MSSASSIARMLIDRVAALDEQHQLVVELDVWVDAVPIVSARVRFADDGEPCADAPIRAAATLEVPPMVSTHPMMFRSRTDETGNAQISLPPGTYEVVAWCGMSTRSAALEVREDTTLDMAVERGVDVMGRVLQTDGQPAKGASVYLVSEEGIGWSGGETDGDGRFTMHAVPPGTYEVDVQSAIVRPETRTIKIDTTLREMLEIHLLETHALTVEVKDVWGRPCYPAIVIARWDDPTIPGRALFSGAPVSGRTDARGLVTLVGLPRARVIVSALGGRRGGEDLHGEVEVDVPQTAHVELVTGAPSRIVGRVVDAHGPRTDVRVRLMSTIHSGLVAETMTDPDGTFEFEGLEGETYRLVARDITRGQERRLDEVVPGDAPVVVQFAD